MTLSNKMKENAKAIIISKQALEKPTIFGGKTILNEISELKTRIEVLEAKEDEENGLYF